MRPVEVYFTFQKPSLQAIWQDPYLAFGHVSCFGVMTNENWFFLNPSRKFMGLKILHAYEEVNSEIASQISNADRLFSFEPEQEMRLPPFVPCTCATVCGYIAGVRAFTVNGLLRKLQALDAQEIDLNGQRPQRRSSR